MEALFQWSQIRGGYGLPLALYAAPLWVNTGVLLSGAIILGALFGRPAIAFVAYGILAALHTWKLETLDSPLALDDLRLLSLVSGLWHSPDVKLLQSIPWLTWMIVSCLVALAVWIVRLILKPRLALRRAFVIGVLPSAFFLNVATPAWWSEESWLAERLERKPVMHSRRESCLRDGLLWCLLIHSRSRPSSPPSDQEVKDARRALEVNSGTEGSTVPDRVLIWVVESFWDPAKTGLFEAEPVLPFFRKLSARFPSGYLLSPKAGGYSLHTHFEILTGIPVSLFPESFVPTVDLASPEVPSVARYFRRLGMDTVSLFSGASQLWNADEAYRAYGIERRLFFDVMREPDKYFPVVRDRILVDAAIHELEEGAKRGRGVFLLAAPSQTHAPYELLEEEDPRRFYPNGLTIRELDRLNSYAWKLRDTDEAMARLVERVARLPGWSVIAFVGDHRPGLEPALLRDGNLRPDARETPLLLWSNRPEKIRGNKDWKVSAFGLSSELIDRLGLPLDPSYWRANRELSRRHPRGWENPSALTSDPDPGLVAFRRWARVWLAGKTHEKKTSRGL